MDWKSVRFDWNRARAFLVTAEEGSLSAAARALGMTQPTLGRQVDALEAELGVVLFERVGRNLALTPSGMELLDSVRAMGDAAGRVSLIASGQNQTVDGTISLSASEIYAMHLLPPILADLRERAPGIDVELVATNESSDLRRREADIAIRNFRPAEPDLIARKVADDHAHLYASARLLDRLGRPLSLAKLSRASFVGLGDPEAFLGGMRHLGLEITHDNLAAVTQSHPVHWGLVRAGLGIGFIPDWIGDADPAVERVLDGALPGFDFPVWLTTHREVHTSRRVRLVYDFLASELAKAAKTWPRT